jgi:hypothetical protein
MTGAGAEVSRDALDAAPADEWRSYDDFAAGIDTYRMASADLTGKSYVVRLADGPELHLDFLDADTVEWSAGEPFGDSSPVRDPYDAVRVRDDVLFLSLPFRSRSRESLTIALSLRTRRAIAARSVIALEAVDDIPQVGQRFWAGVLDGGEPSGEVPAASRDLVGHRNIYRYSPAHLYEHVYFSSERYAWQCIQGVQRGHGDVDLSTVWKLDDGLYLFCFREFKIAVASVWLHDLGYALKTTGVFLGLNESRESEHSKAGGHIYPLGAVAYPDVQPI